MFLVTLLIQFHPVPNRTFFKTVGVLRLSERKKERRKERKKKRKKEKKKASKKEREESKN